MILSLQAFQRNLPEVMLRTPLGALPWSHSLGEKVDGEQRWAWSLWLLDPLLRQQTGPQSLAHPVWTKPVILTILSHGWVLLGLGFSSVELG